MLFVQRGQTPDMTSAAVKAPGRDQEGFHGHPGMDMVLCPVVYHPDHRYGTND